VKAKRKATHRRGRKTRDGKLDVKFGVRMPPNLHQRIVREASKSGRSLNEEIIHRLDISVTSPELEFSITARDHLARAASNIMMGALRQEIEQAMTLLRQSFRDGPVMVNQALTTLSRDILHRELEAVIVALQQAQVNNARNRAGEEHA
jgi:hypothetical protein